MPITILVDSDTLSVKDIANCVLASNRAFTKWSPAWGTTVLLTTDSTQQIDMVAHITNAFRDISCYGYHTVKNGIQTYNLDGSHTLVANKDHITVGLIPTCYISPDALLKNIYGTYTPAHWSKAIWNLLRTKITRASIQTSQAKYRQGIVTILIHELMEMVADAHIDQVSAPDSTNSCWLIEVADHVSGYYSVDILPDKTVCVIPVATLPSYYDLKGKRPFDTINASSTPFDTTSPTFYGYIKTILGAYVAIIKGSVHHL